MPSAIIPDLEAHYQALKLKSKTLHMAFLCASPSVIKAKEDTLYSGIPQQIISNHKDDVKEILINLERTGLGLRYRGGLLSKETITESLREQGCLGLHLSVNATKDGSSLIFEEFHGFEGRMVGEKELNQMIRPNQLKFVIVTGQNANMAGQKFQ
jgi:hypothetical protein